jgi:hypothetical protein
MAARALSDEGDDPRLTDRVGPPVSEREATAESDKQREGGNGQIGQVARALSDEGDDPRLTDRVGPPISERETTAELDKQREGGDGRIRQAEQATGRLGQTGREEMGRGWAGKEERRPGRNYFLG